MGKAPTKNETPEVQETWTENEQAETHKIPETIEEKQANEPLSKTLKSTNSGNGEYIDNWRWRQSMIDRIWDLAEAAYKRWDMAAYRDYMNQIENLNDDAVLWE